MASEKNSWEGIFILFWRAENSNIWRFFQSSATAKDIEQPYDKWQDWSVKQSITLC